MHFRDRSDSWAAGRVGMRNLRAPRRGIGLPNRIARPSYPLTGQRRRSARTGCEPCIPSIISVQRINAGLARGAKPKQTSGSLLCPCAAVTSDPTRIFDTSRLRQPLRLLPRGWLRGTADFTGRAGDHKWLFRCPRRRRSANTAASIMPHSASGEPRSASR